MKSESEQNVDELFTKLRLQVLDIRQTSPEAAQEMRSLLAQLEDMVESLTIDSIQLKNIKSQSKKK